MLAYGDRVNAKLFAHDANPARLRDLAPRAKRAGVTIEQLTTEGCKLAAPFDLVLCDVPCSGSGAWRRSPEGKWSLTAEKLDLLTQRQSEIVSVAAPLVSEGGTLAYATCSFLSAENGDRVQKFLAENQGFTLGYERQFLPSEGGDGFYVAHLTRAKDVT